MIYDRMGNVVQFNNGTIPLSSIELPDTPGLYILRLLDGKNSVLGNWKVIKE